MEVFQTPLLIFVAYRSLAWSNILTACAVCSYKNQCKEASRGHDERQRRLEGAMPRDHQGS